VICVRFRRGLRSACVQHVRQQLFSPFRLGTMVSARSGRDSGERTACQRFVTSASGDTLDRAATGITRADNFTLSPTSIPRTSPQFLRLIIVIAPHLAIVMFFVFPVYQQRLPIHPIRFGCCGRNVRSATDGRGGTTPANVSFCGKSCWRFPRRCFSGLLIGIPLMRWERR